MTHPYEPTDLAPFARMTDLAELYRIDHFNDTFAMGHYARVMDAVDVRSGQAVALKVLRPEHMAPGDDPRWEVLAFGNEAELLLRLKDSPYAVRLLDCGFLSGDGEAPHGGHAESFALDVPRYVHALATYHARGWRPYLALHNLPRNDNLLYLMKPNQPGVRRRLPTEEGLALALQFCELLRTAHARGLAYLDHKLEHVYWDGQRLVVIDFNSSRQFTRGSADEAQQVRNDIRNLCVGILYPAFTGLSPVAASLRPQPGDARAVEARYNGVSTLDFGVEPTLSAGIQEVLARGAASAYERVEPFLAALQDVAARHGWDFPHAHTDAATRAARGHLRDGLARLRAGQVALREARDLFRDAAIVDGVSADLEDELRRLVKAVNDALNARPVP